MNARTNRVILHLTGYGSLFLGNLTDAECNDLTRKLAGLGVENILRDDATDISYDDSYDEEVLSSEFIYANPQTENEDQTTALNALSAVKVATTKTLYPERCTIGRREHKIALPPITKDVLEDVSVDEAIANLAFFFPYLAESFSSETITLMRSQKYLSASDISKFSKADKYKLESAKTKMLQKMLSGNAKLRKSKIPRSLGETLGLRVDSRDDFVDSEVPGSVGLSLLPNNSLIKNGDLETGERSYRTIINDPNTKVYRYATRELLRSLKKGSFSEDEFEAFFAHRENSFSLVKLLTNETLDQFTSQSCCVYSSTGCRTICLYASGGRYYAIIDMLLQLAKSPLKKTADSQEVDDLEQDLDAETATVEESIDPIALARKSEQSEKKAAFQKDEGYNRMLTGFWHTAFLANPIYYIRLLVEAIKLHITNHKSELCTLITNQDLLLSTDEIIRYLPPSVRLNVYSDYVWEEICPALFKIFDGTQTFMGVRMLRVQFYDYTKIPGRWPAATRKEIAKQFSIKDPKSSYRLPPNYHITFSFSGTKQSYAQSLFASRYAKQNSTVVFYSIDTTSTIFDALENDANAITDAALQNTIRDFKSWAAKLRSALTLKQRASASVEKGMGLIPQTYKGVRVIDGDAYDLRFLDTILAAQLRQDALVIGLKYKQPRNIKIDIGSGYSVNPLTAVLFNQFVSTASFVQLRLGLGFETAVGKSFTNAVTLVITPNELGQDAVKKTLLTFANENGETFGTFDDIDKLVDRINQDLNEVAELSKISR